MTAQVDRVTGMTGSAVRLALVLIAAATLALATPQPAGACSCVPFEPLATYADDPETAIFSGTVGALLGDRHPFVVERWYAGSGAAPAVAVRSAESREPGSDVVAVNTCGITFRAGERWLLVASGAPGPVFEPSICLPSARLETGEGRAMLAEAEQDLGPGREMAQAPPTAEPTPAGAASPSSRPANPPVPALVIAALLAAVVLGVALGYWNGRRRARR